MTTVEVEEYEHIQDPCSDRSIECPIPSATLSRGAGEMRAVEYIPPIPRVEVSDMLHLNALQNFSSALPAGPLRKLDIRRLVTRGQLIEQLMKEVPLNDYGLPDYIYRADLLNEQEFYRTISWAKTQAGTKVENAAQATTTPNFLRSRQSDDIGLGVTYSPHELMEILDSARVELSYAEGFPALPSGRPFWTQLETEPKVAHEAFEAYIQLGGARQIHNLFQYDMSDLQEWFNTYYWNYRVVAFDLYRIAHHKKIQLQRLLDVQNKHYAMAERYLGTVSRYLDGVSDEEMERIGPEKAVNMMEKLVKIQRMSVGLSATGNERAEELQKVQPVNIIMAQVSGDRQRVQKVDDVDLLMDNPDAIDAAQELIIKMQHNQLTDGRDK